MRERDVIRRLFNFSADSSVLAGIGDDAAVVLPPPGAALAVSSDTLIEDVHFFSDVDSFLLARKAAAASLSDMAAMGAKPLWMTVALTATSGESWLSRFADGLRSSADEYGYVIIGGDLCRGEKVSVTTTAIGAVSHSPLLRSGAQVGDKVWISGMLGEAALATHYRYHPRSLSKTMSAEVAAKLDNPSPRARLGCELATVASAAIDLSDGLIVAARAIAEQSQVGILLRLNDMPIAPTLQEAPEKLRRQFLLGGGDDYELLFCAPANAALPSGMFCIGEVIAGDSVDIEGGDVADGHGYEHDFGE